MYKAPKYIYIKAETYIKISAKKLFDISSVSKVTIEIYFYDKTSISEPTSFLTLLSRIEETSWDLSLSASFAEK